MDRFSCSHSNEGRILSENYPFNFACHLGVSCFARCCRNADMYLYPYDIIRLKSRLDITSSEFLRQYTLVAFRENPYFPSVMLKMSDSEDKACLFLKRDGCSVCEDRPFLCRAYPLARAVTRYGDGKQRGVCYFIARHEYCMGHQESRKWTVGSWMTDQKLDAFNAMNDPAGRDRYDILDQPLGRARP